MAFQLRRDTTANWTSKNPVLAAGELAEDFTLKILKLGDGVTAWNSLGQYGVGPTGSTGPAGPAGQVILNFGSEPGVNEATVMVSDTRILSTSIPNAEFAAVATSDHTASDHTYTALYVQLLCGAPVAGVGFTIYATSEEQISGTFNVNYRWS
jgi:hypothetical protein